MAALRLAVRVHPGAARSRLHWDGRLARVWVHAPAAEGEANRAVVAALAAWLGVAPGALRLVAGSRSRSKLVEVGGLERLPPPH